MPAQNGHREYFTLADLVYKFDRQYARQWKRPHKIRTLAMARRVVNHIPLLIRHRPDLADKITGLSYQQAARLALLCQDRHVTLYYQKQALKHLHTLDSLFENLTTAIHFNARATVHGLLRRLLDRQLSPVQIIKKLDTFMTAQSLQLLYGIDRNTALHECAVILCRMFPESALLVKHLISMPLPSFDLKPVLSIMEQHLLSSADKTEHVVNVMRYLHRKTPVSNFSHYRLRDGFVQLITSLYYKDTRAGKRIFPRNLLQEMIHILSYKRYNSQLKSMAAMIILSIACRSKTVEDLKAFFKKRLVPFHMNLSCLQHLFDHGVERLEDHRLPISRQHVRFKLLFLKLVCRHILKVTNLNYPKHHQLSKISRRVLRRGILQLSSKGIRIDVTTRRELLENLQYIVRIVSDEVGMKRPKIKLRRLNTNDYAVYDEKTNTILMNPKEISPKNKDNKILWLLVHELGHAYQKHQIKLSRLKHAPLAANFNTYFHDDWLPKERLTHPQHIDALYVHQPIEAHANQFAHKVLSQIENTLGSC